LWKLRKEGRGVSVIVIPVQVKALVEGLQTAIIIIIILIHPQQQEM
jgi:hypothetical protein